MVFFLWTHTVNILKPRRENHLSTQSLESLFMSLKSSVSLWTTHSPPRPTSSALGIFPAWFCDFRVTRHGSDFGGICANYCLIGLSWSVRGPGAVQIKYVRLREVVGYGQLAGDVSLSVCEVLVYWIRQDNYHKWPVGTVWGPRGLKAGVYAFSLIFSFLVPGHMQLLAWRRGIYIVMWVTRMPGLWIQTFIAKQGTFLGSASIISPRKADLVPGPFLLGRMIIYVFDTCGYWKCFFLWRQWTI